MGRSPQRSRIFVLRKLLFFRGWSAATQIRDFLGDNYGANLLPRGDNYRANLLPRGDNYRANLLLRGDNYRANLLPREVITIEPTCSPEVITIEPTYSLRGDNYRANLLLRGDNYRANLLPRGDNYRANLLLRGDNYRANLLPKGDNYRANLLLRGDNYRANLLLRGDNYRANLLPQRVFRGSEAVLEKVERCGPWDRLVLALEAEGLQHRGNTGRGAFDESEVYSGRGGQRRRPIVIDSHYDSQCFRQINDGTALKLGQAPITCLDVYLQMFHDFILHILRWPESYNPQLPMLMRPSVTNPPL
ncbi:unnamed protein product [Coregonus sp. 'balchen']|nr:unnamed protein product [Coregonus sp. 'balchen']